MRKFFLAFLCCRSGVKTTEKLEGHENNSDTTKKEG